MVRLHHVAFAAFALSACLDEGTAPEDIEVEEAPVSDDTVFHEVSLHVRADGTFDMSEPRSITAGEQRAQNEMKAAMARGEAPALAIAQDTTCSAFSFWLYDRKDLTGNRICFSGPGSTDLHTWARYLPFVLRPSSWALAKGSIFAGSRGGSLAGFGTTTIHVCPSGRLLTTGSTTMGGGFGVGEIPLPACAYMAPTCTGGSCVAPFVPYELAFFDLTGPAFYLTQY